MPDLTLTDDELRDMCIALRSAAHRAMEAATERKSDPRISQSFASDRRRFDELAEKLDAIRERSAPGSRAHDTMRSLWRS
jgi:hypothetical protein